MTVIACRGVGGTPSTRVEVSDSMIEALAKSWLEADFAYSMYISDPLPYPSWEGAPEEFREGVLKSIRDRLNDITAPFDVRHTWWVAEMVSKGWTLGELDFLAKKHPYLKPFDQLPESAQFRQIMFVSICRAFYATLLAS